MRTYQLYLDNLNVPKEKIAICLGYFDGVHQGHKKLINFAVKNSQYKIALLTFDKSVSSLIDNGKSKEVLTSLNDRFRIISRLKVDYYYVLHISKNFLNMSKEEFVEFLHILNVEEIYVGNDYRFGKNRSGDVSFLKKYFKVYVASDVKDGDEKISSSRIVELIKNGEMQKANLLMGQNYQVEGIVKPGHHNGTKFGIKTANIDFEDNYVVPKFGVYKVIIYVDTIPHLAIANVGVHPTVGQENKPLLEVHIPNFDQELYGKTIFVEFLEFVRPEMKFSSSEELVKQIKQDLTLLNK